MKSKVLILTTLLVVAIIGGFFVLRMLDRTEQSELATTALLPSRGATAQLFGNGFVGSAVCAECHAEIAQRYAETHPMSRSSRKIGDEVIVEDYEKTLLTPAGARKYSVERNGAQLFHHEFVTDAAGKSLYDQAEKIEFEIGSGRRGRAFVLQRDGRLYQSPIAWYSQTAEWGLSPGYSPEKHQRFDRKLVTECVLCHVGQPAMVDVASHQFAPGPFVEAGIGCERCHGAGREHVAQQKKGATTDGALSIVQPKKLAAAERDSVCYQCHLRSDYSIPRSNRPLGAFKPGEKYEEQWMAFATKRNDVSRANSVVEQFRASACFNKSAGKMGCISCHDPHSRPAESEQAAFYQQRCATCHPQNACGLTEEKRAEAPANGSCIFCHMPPLPAKGIPHTALTDHRVMRVPSAIDAQKNADPDPLAELELFVSDSTANGVPAAEIERAKGILYATTAAGRQDRRAAQRAISVIRASHDDPTAVILEIGDDDLLLERLAPAFAIAGKAETALACWQRLHQRQPTNEEAFSSDVLFHTARKDFDGGLPLVEKLLKLNHRPAQYHWLHAQLLMQAGRTEDAIQAAESAAERDPSNLDYHEWLQDAHVRGGNMKKAAQHHSFFDHLTPPNLSDKK